MFIARILKIIIKTPYMSNIGGMVVNELCYIYVYMR